MIRLFEFKEMLFKMNLGNLETLDLSGSHFLLDESKYLSLLTSD